MSIGSQISARRKQLKITQQDLAERLDVSFQAVSLWERDECLPETDKLKNLATALNTSIAFLMEEKSSVGNSWELHDEMFSGDNMLDRLKKYLQAKKMKESQKAMRIMLDGHKGMYRESINEEKVPYVFHPLMMACHAFALGIDSDEVIATIFLHDALEKDIVSIDEMEFSPAIVEAVKTLTFKEYCTLPYEESKQNYYDSIARNKTAAIVKLLDRCNNVSVMVTGFKATRIIDYINSTEKYILPLIEYVKKEYDDYFDAVFLIKYQILSVLETLKRTV